MTTSTHSVGNNLPETQETSGTGKGSGRFPPAFYALLIAVMVAGSNYAILPVWVYMSRLWLDDPLRAIGAVFPLLAFAGTLVAWRRLGWSMNDGRFWALSLVALVILIVRASNSSIVDIRLHQMKISILHPGLLLFVYGVGAVLFFGGPRLLRASIAPLCLLLLVNPVPYFYNVVVDLPLQFLCANTARHFAHLIGLQPTGEQLRMMFSPTFGMMIVPGCNGVRGSVTLGYLALIFGYIRHLRPRTLALTTVAAFLMGYVLNLLRLCVLVIYYRIGLSHPSIQPYGAGVDYAIGCTLFLFATLAVGLFIRWIEPKPELQKTDAAMATRKPVSSASQRAAATRALCFLTLALVFIVPMIGRGEMLHAGTPNEQALLSSFPAQVGPYRLVRTYPERDNTGSIRFALADYSTPPNGNDPPIKITFGFFAGSSMHFVAYSRFVQGIRPNWTGSFDDVDAGAQPPLKVHFVTTFYDDGTSREYDAESACYESGCNESTGKNSKWIYWSLPTFTNLLFASDSNHLTILLRGEWADTDTRSNEMLRSQFEVDARQFTEQLNLRALLHEDGTPSNFELLGDSSPGVAPGVRNPRRTTISNPAGISIAQLMP